MPETEHDITVTTVQDEPTGEPAGQEPVEPTATDPQDTNTDDATSDEVDVDKLKAEIAKLRRENAKARTGAKEQAAKEAREAALAEAEQARNEAIEALKAEYGTKFTEVAKVLGLVNDDKPLTPEELVEQAKAEAAEAAKARDEKDRKYRDLLIEVAVQDAANMHDARADRLLDSRSFMRTVTALDPDSDGFRAAVAEAVKTATDADSDLKATKPAPPREIPTASGGTTVAGSEPRDPNTMTAEQFRAMKIHRPNN